MLFKRLAAALAAAALSACAMLAPGPVLAQSAALKSGSTTLNNCASWGAGNLIQDSGVKCGSASVQVDATGAGSALLTGNVYGMSTAGLLNNMVRKPFVFTKSTATTEQDAGDFECYRHANYTVADHSHPELRGWVNPCFYTYTVAEAGGFQRFEWAHLVRLDNYSMIADDTENTGLYVQARKFGTAPTFGFVTEIYDQTANPAAGSVADEHDVSAKGTDNNNARVIADFWARNPWDSTATEVAWGLRFNTDANTKIKNAIMFNGHYGNGINFAGSTIDSTAITLGDSHALAFDNTQFRKMFFSSGATYLSVPTLGNIFSWSDAGQFTGVSLNASSGAYLFGGATASYPQLLRNATGIDAKLADNSGYAPFRSDYFVSNGGRYCLDITCVRSFWVQGGVLYYNSGSGNVMSFSDGGAFTANSVNASSTLYLSTNGKICLDGGTCSKFMSYDGANLKFMNGSTAMAIINMSTGQIGAGTPGYTAGISTGVSCASVSTSTMLVVGGIVTRC